MSDWLTDSISVDASLSSGALALRLLLGLVCGCGVALSYVASHGQDKSDRATLAATLVLLSVLIAMVSMVIGNSVARAFSLVGALSIVRFRTVVDDTRDTAFVIFAVVVGMAVGTGLVSVPVVGIPIVGAAAIALHRIRRTATPPREEENVLNVRMGLGRDPEAILSVVLTQYLEEFRLVAMSTARQGAALDFRYTVKLRPGASLPSLVAQLNRIEGVQSVDFRESDNR